MINFDFLLEPVKVVAGKLRPGKIYCCPPADPSVFEFGPSAKLALHASSNLPPLATRLILKISLTAIKDVVVAVVQGQEKRLLLLLHLFFFFFGAVLSGC